MKSIITLVILTLATHVLGQTRTLTGKIIDNEFNPHTEIGIFRTYGKILGESDSNGTFNIIVPADTKILIVADVGMEWKSLYLLRDCNYLEIFIQPAATYDFMSPSKVYRIRKKEFGKLQKLHQSAFEKGILKSEKPCFNDQFISYRKSDHA